MNELIHSRNQNMRALFRTWRLKVRAQHIYSPRHACAQTEYIDDFSAIRSLALHLKYSLCSEVYFDKIEMCHISWVRQLF